MNRVVEPTSCVIITKLDIPKGFVQRCESQLFIFVLDKARQYIWTSFTVIFVPSFPLSFFILNDYAHGPWIGVPPVTHLNSSVQL